LSDQKGEFAIDQVGDKEREFEIRAFPPGGGVATARGVTVNGRAVLQVIGTGGASGTVASRGGKAVEEFEIELLDSNGGKVRKELFRGARGVWSINDLSPGRYSAEIEGLEGRDKAQFNVEVGGRAIADFKLPGRGAIAARAIDLETGRPIAGVTARALFREPRRADEEPCTSGADGLGCEIRGVVAGEVDFVLFSRERGELAPPDGRGFSETLKYASASIPVTVVAGETLDLGNVSLARYRTAHGRFGMHPYDQPGGTLGFEIDSKLARSEHGRDSAIRVIAIAADGPAATSGLEVGDVIIGVDGHDIRGRRSYLYQTLSSVPEGSTLEFELERGATITIEAGEAPETRIMW
jgi:hypothetical protein